jgi:hypothetical protein
MAILPTMVRAQYTVTGNGFRTVTIIGYSGAGGVVVIPNQVGGLTVTIPQNVKSVVSGAFGGCTSLTNISVNTADGFLSSSNGVLFDKAEYTLFEYPEGLTNDAYTIPGTVTNIGELAFYDCASLTSITIPDTVTNIGDAAFEDCTNLANISVAADNPAYTSINGVLFDKAEDILIQYPVGLTNGAYTIPGGVTNVEDYAFAYCDSLTSVTIPAGVASIGHQAFEGCTSLTSATIPASVTNIGVQAFVDCTSLTNFSVTADNRAYSSTNGVLFDKAQDTLIQYPAGLTDGAYTVPGSVTSIGEFAFADCDSLTNVTIPGSITTIQYEGILADAFSGCANLTAVYFAGNAPGIEYGSGVFAGDTNAIIYYLPGTTGWPLFNSESGLNPAVLWNPQAQNDASFGVQNNQFGFNITGNSNLVVVVEVCTNLANPVWSPVATNTLNTFVGTNGTSYFSDPQWTNYPARFYRLQMP